VGRIPQRDLGRGQTLADEALELQRKLDASQGPAPVSV
jgi:hypothetical protein